MRAGPPGRSQAVAWTSLALASDSPSEGAEPTIRPRRRNVCFPCGSTAFRLGAVDRFDVQFEYPDTFGTDPITVQASGYDAAFDRLASVQVTADSAAR